jgi:predicted metal-dependent peptidase
MNTTLMRASALPKIEKRREAPTDAEIRLTKKRISRARTTVASFIRFLGHLILKTTPVVALPEHGVDTAAVAPDGTTYFNAHFVATLTDAELCGLVIHETLHPALLCWKRQGNRSALVEGSNGAIYTLWNVAHDLSFNPEIIKLAQDCLSAGKIALPKCAALEPKYKGMSAERIYALELEEAKKRPSKKGSGQGKSSPWGEKGGKGQGKVVGKVTCSGTGGTSDEIGDDLRPDLSTTEVGKKAAKGDKLAQQKMDNDWRVSVVAAAIAHQKKHGRGHLPAGFQKLVNELQEAKVDWRDVLSQWIGEKGVNLDFTMRRPGRRSESCGVYMASYQKYGIDDVIVLWDTSGSMNGRETAILSEIQAICEDLDLVLRIICCDTRVASDTRDVKEAVDMIGEIKGGGGSDYTPAFDLLEEEQYEGVVIAFTDGHIGVPAEQPPRIKDVLWCLEPSTSKHSWGDQDPTNGAWGTVLYMED